MIEKCELLASLRARLRTDLEALERRQRDAAKGATHEESRSEHAKDTRATEQSYLARGLAARVADLRRILEALMALELREFGPDDPVAVTALVVLSCEEPDRNTTTQETWFVVPGAGGLDLDADGERVRTITPASPLGRSLLGRRVGDDGLLKTPRGERAFSVLAVY